ncbi:hypothetical protein CF326_g9763 [Tilletia indica]|uniref:Uncharacterized protein n=1 Tax=Tilletia indica TaxID=43049 RepID=A0A177TXH5_9BASI|nr:hypothetical protein CF326_g9763 [Tilletia indica]KAE8259082.1 hypothetical protein A4X13_0g1249 [Tilletia indica]
MDLSTPAPVPPASSSAAVCSSQPNPIPPPPKMCRLIRHRTVCSDCHRPLPQGPTWEEVEHCAEAKAKAEEEGKEEVEECDEYDGVDEVDEVGEEHCEGCSTPSDLELE